MDIENYEEYIEKLSRRDLMSLKEKLKEKIVFDNFAQMREWYQREKRYTNDKRNIIFVLNPITDKVVALSLLRKNIYKKTICLINIENEFRDKSLEKRIIEESMIWLETTKPVIIIDENKKSIYKPFIETYKWQKTEDEENFYNKHLQNNNQKQRVRTKVDN